MSDETLFFETLNSLYFIDPIENTYFRMPRAGTEEQEVYSDRLAYSEWLPFNSYEVSTDFGVDVLHIMAPDSVFGIFTSEIIRQGLAKEYSE